MTVCPYALGVGKCNGVAFSCMSGPVCLDADYTPDFEVVEVPAGGWRWQYRATGVGSDPFPTALAACVDLDRYLLELDD